MAQAKEQGQPMAQAQNRNTESTGEKIDVANTNRLMRSLHASDDYSLIESLKKKFKKHGSWYHTSQHHLRVHGYVIPLVGMVRFQCR